MNRTTENNTQQTPAQAPNRPAFRQLLLSLLLLALIGLPLHTALLEAVHKYARSADKRIIPISKQELITSQQQTIAAQNRTIEHLEGILSYALAQDYSGQPFKTMTVTATAYTAREEECDSQPWVTASGTPSRVGVIAVSRDMEQIGIELGDLVIIKGMGLFRVEDRMNRRWTNRIDILHANLEAARRFAKREVEVMWVGRSQTASLETDQPAPLG